MNISKHKSYIKPTDIYLQLCEGWYYEVIKLELLPCDCMPAYTNEVASMSVQTHVIYEVTWCISSHLKLIISKSNELVFGVGRPGELESGHSAHLVCNNAHEVCVKVKSTLFTSHVSLSSVEAGQ